MINTMTANTINTGTAGNAVQSVKEAQKAAQKAKAAVKAATTEEAKQAAENFAAERKEVRGLIAKMPPVSVPVCTESRKTVIDKDGKQMFIVLYLSSLFASIGHLIDKAGSTDFYFSLFGKLVKLPGKGNPSNRFRSFLSSLVDACYSAQREEDKQTALNIVLSFREKYDFIINDSTGKITMPDKDEVLRAIAIVRKTEVAAVRIKNLRVDHFGLNPSRLQFCKSVSEVVREYKTNGIAAGDEKRKELSLVIENGQRILS